MRVIDNKGRLFGVINIFDLFVLSIIIFIAFFAIKWTRIADDPAWMKVRLSHTRCVGLMQLPSYVAELVRKDDEARDSEGIVMARIEKIVSNEVTPVATYVSGRGEKAFVNNASIRDITVIVDLATYERKSDVYSLITNLPLKVGNDISFNAKNYFSQISIRKILNK